MSHPLRIGIVGPGGIVRSHHAPGLAKIPGVEIAAVAAGRVESAREFCAQWAPGAQVYEHWRDVVQQGDLDAILIGTSPFLHEPVTVAALDAGRHVFCQARMSTDLASAQRMLAAAEAHPGLVTMLCPPPHALSTDAFVRSLLQEGRLGDVRHVCARTRSAQFLDPLAPAHWRQRFEINGKNILTLGIYAEVLRRWFGDLEPLHARGLLHVRERQGYRVRVPDALEVWGRLASGPTFTMELSGVYPGPAADYIEILGSRATLRVHAATDTVEMASPGDKDFASLEIPAGLARPWRVEADFIEAVRNPDAPRPRPDFRDGVAYMAVVEKVWELIGGQSAL